MNRPSTFSSLRCSRLLQHENRLGGEEVVQLCERERERRRGREVMSHITGSVTHQSRSICAVGDRVVCPSAFFPTFRV